MATDFVNGVIVCVCVCNSKIEAKKKERNSIEFRFDSELFFCRKK